MERIVAQFCYICRCGQGPHSDAERHGKRNNGGKQTAWNFYNYQMLLLACRLWHSWRLIVIVNHLRCIVLHEFPVFSACKRGKRNNHGEKTARACLYRPKMFYCCLPACLPIQYVCMYVCMCVSVCLPACLPACMSILSALILSALACQFYQRDNSSCLFSLKMPADFASLPACLPVVLIMLCWLCWVGCVALCCLRCVGCALNPACLYVSLLMCLPACLLMCLYVCLFICLTVCLLTCPHACMPACLCVWMLVRLCWMGCVVLVRLCLRGCACAWCVGLVYAWCVGLVCAHSMIHIYTHSMHVHPLTAWYIYTLTHSMTRRTAQHAIHTQYATHMQYMHAYTHTHTHTHTYIHTLTACYM